MSPFLVSFCLTSDLYKDLIWEWGVKVVSDHIIPSLRHGGALVESMTFNRRVVGSTPALATM